MNKLYLFIFLLAFSFPQINIYSQTEPEWPTFTMTAKDITLLSGANGQDSILEWSVYIQQTNQGQPGVHDLEFCCAQYNWYFNMNIFKNPSIGNLVLTNRGGQTDLPNGLRPPTFQVDSTTVWPNVGSNMRLLKTSGNLPNSSINFFISGSFPGTKALQMKLTTNGHAFNNVPLDLRWRIGSIAPNTLLAYFVPNPPGPDSANPQFAQSLLDTVVNQYTVINDSTLVFPPIANFNSTVTNIIEGNSVSYFDSSSNSPTSWNWTFPGGTPSSSNVQNPSNIVYNTPGIYNVTLIVTNDYGYDSLTKINYIIVNSICPPTWSNIIQMIDAANNKDSLKFGTAPNATNGIDTCFGERDLPPIPPDFDFRFLLNAPLISESSKIDIRPEPIDNFYWTMRIVPSSQSAYPITLTWDNSSFPSNGSFYLKDGITGTLLNVNMKNQSTCILDANYGNMKISFEYFQTANINIDSGWNIVSLPYKSTSMRIYDIFPNLNGGPYGYVHPDYTNIDTAKSGQGFWIKINRDTTYKQIGLSVSPKNISVRSGWNMIGPFDEKIPVSALTSVPAGLIIYPLYEYYNNRYEEADTLFPGKGYWVKTNSDGFLMKNTSDNIFSNYIINSDSLMNFTKLIITDNNAQTSILYLGNSNRINGNYVLPPIPPNGIFDVRYGTGTYVESYDKNNRIDLNSASYPVIIKAVNLQSHRLRIKDIITGNLVNSILEEDTEIELNSGIVNIMLTEENLIPQYYSLSQNYPNPFNPSTIIKYQLPEDGNVKIIIYNVLGKEVLTLVNEFEKAGSYEFKFNATNLASGMYFYKMQSNNFSEIKRMVLIK